MKFCTKCQTDKPREAFAKNNNRPDGLQAQCRACKKMTDAANHQLNKAAQQERNRININKTKDFVFRYLLEHPCIDCGETDPIVLEFDHRDPTKKSFNIGSCGAMSEASISAEIAKCDVRCANDHRRKTATDRGYYRVLRTMS